MRGYRSARAQRRRGAILAAGLLVVAVGAGWAALRSGRPAGVVLGLGALATTCLGLAWLVRPRPDPERWRRGAAGEATTALLLDRLSRRRWAVWHDLRIPGSRSNVDHLVIGPTGVWVIDSKATRAAIRVRWGSVRFGDRRLDSGPTVWEAQVVADRLRTPVRPLIVVHGDGLRRRGGRCGGVRVVPAGGLLAQVRRRRWRGRLGRDEIDMLADRAGAVFVPAGRFLEKGVTSHG
jgi:hypothetical protein